MKPSRVHKPGDRDRRRTVRQHGWVLPERRAPWGFWQRAKMLHLLAGSLEFDGPLRVANDAIAFGVGSSCVAIHPRHPRTAGWQWRLASLGIELERAFAVAQGG